MVNRKGWRLPSAFDQKPADWLRACGLRSIVAVRVDRRSTRSPGRGQSRPRGMPDSLTWGTQSVVDAMIALHQAIKPAGLPAALTLQGSSLKDAMNPLESGYGIPAGELNCGSS